MSHQPSAVSHQQTTEGSSTKDHSTMTHKGKCHYLLDDLSDYLDGEASEAVCAEIEAHMRECENCRVVVDTLNQTLYLYHTLPQPDLPEGLRARLYKSLDLEPYFTPKS